MLTWEVEGDSGQPELVEAAQIQHRAVVLLLGRPHGVGRRARRGRRRGRGGRGRLGGRTSREAAREAALGSGTARRRRGERRGGRRTRGAAGEIDEAGERLERLGI